MSTAAIYQRLLIPIAVRFLSPSVAYRRLIHADVCHTPTSVESHRRLLSVDKCCIEFTSYARLLIRRLLNVNLCWQRRRWRRSPQWLFIEDTVYLEVWICGFIGMTSPPEYRQRREFIATYYITMTFHNKKKHMQNALYKKLWSHNIPACWYFAIHIWCIAVHFGQFSTLLISAILI